MTTEIYEPAGFALEIFKKRYARHENESWQEACDRVASHMAAAETNGHVAEYKELFSDILKKNLFFPGGRIWYGSGRPKAQLLNCFVIPTKDSREGWGKTLHDTVVISGTGGGVGCNYSPTRPRNSKIEGTGGIATGAVSEMRMVNSIGDELKAGGGRRIALMMALNLTHGDILEFLDAKLDKNQLNNANVSVIFDEDPERFFKLVKEEGILELKHNGKVVGSASAKELWHKIVSNALKGGEPGLLNGYLANKMSNIWYFRPLICTNPCITGDTLIAVADGRNAVSIKQLADEGNNVPVYSTNVETGQVEIKTGRNPRKTGASKEVWKLTLDDGSILRATPNHKIMRLDRQYVELKDLKPGDSVFPFNTFSSNGYRQVCGTGAQMSGGARRNRRQYRLINEFFNGPTDAKRFAIHHANFDCTDDSIDNLKMLEHEEHRRLHTEKMMGAKNQYHRMDEQWKNDFASHPGEENGRFSGHTNEELVVEGREVFEKNGKLTQELWVEHAENKGLPQFLGNDFRFGSFTNFRNQVVTNHRVVSVEFDCHEDVYNITVDDNHNYHVVTSGDGEKNVVSSGLCVKNCGEIWLVEYDCCDLGSLVLPRFIYNDGGKLKIDRPLMKRVISIAIRFLDNVLTANNYPMLEIKEMCSMIRRIGLGVTGLDTMLMELGLKYNSSEALEYVDSLMNFIKNCAYEAGIELAKEKGSFPAFDAEKFLQSGFMKTMKPSIRSDIRKHGIRFCAGLTLPPVGTGSMVCNVDSGIEKAFGPAWNRCFRDGDNLKNEIVIHPIFKRKYLAGEDVSHFQTVWDLSMRDHFEMQRVCQKHIDNAVSKTINLPPGTSIQELSELYMEFFPDLKGVTVYPEGSRENQPITPLSVADAIAHIDAEVAAGPTSDDSCRGGVCDVPWAKDVVK